MRFSLFSVAWLAALFLVFPASSGFAQGVISVTELTALGSNGLEQIVFMPGEEIRYRARVEVLAAASYTARLVITAPGWYETHEAGPFSGPRTIEWGSPAEPLYTSGDVCQGKASLFLDIRSAGGGPVTLQGRPQGYFTIQCPQGLPTTRSEPITVGTNPWDMALSKDNRFLYVTSQDDHIITVIDLDQWQTAAILPENWEQVNEQIRACQKACPAMDLQCWSQCDTTYRVVGRPAGVAPADLSSGGQRMLVADYQLERIHIIERAGSQHRLAGYITIPRPPPVNVPLNLSDLIVNPNNEVFVTDFRDHQVFRLNLDPPNNITPLDIEFAPFVGGNPREILVDPLAPNQNLYVLCPQVIKMTRAGTPLDVLTMNVGVLSVAMALNPDPILHELYVLMSPTGDIDPSRLRTSAYVYYWNLDDPTPAGGSGPRYYENASLWDIAPISKGDLRGKVAYVVDSYVGELRLLNLESRILMRGCSIPTGVGSARLLEDPVRNRVYIGNWPGKSVEYVYAE
jgi:hypothetical protein